MRNLSQEKLVTPVKIFRPFEGYFYEKYEQNKNWATQHKFDFLLKKENKIDSLNVNLRLMVLLLHREW